MKISALKRESPCKNCIRVPDPERCDNKNCAPWRHWFIDRWDRMRKDYDLPVVEVGDESPCRDCYCPEQMCAIPCTLQAAWLKKKGE